MTNPTPWTWEMDEEEDACFILDANGNDVAILASGNDKETAEIIVKAVNGYDQ
jgi:hypothetical protein